MRLDKCVLWNGLAKIVRGGESNTFVGVGVHEDRELTFDIVSENSAIRMI